MSEEKGQVYRRGDTDYHNCSAQREAQGNIYGGSIVARDAATTPSGWKFLGARVEVSYCPFCGFRLPTGALDYLGATFTKNA